MPKARNSSPARSQGGIPTPRRNQPRRSRSVCSPALSTASGRLTSTIDQFKEKNMDSFAVSPLTTRRSVLSDNTEIEIPRRKSWWKNLNENSREVMEFLEENKADQNTAIEDIVDIEVFSQEKKNYTLDLPESSDNESINSIVLPQRKLFTQKENHQSQKKFGQVVGTRETVKPHKNNTTHHDNTITEGTKELFRGTKRNKPIFPAALLGLSPNKTTADNTKENIATEPVVRVRNIFGNRPATKRKNMFADFVMSESESDISDIQPKKVFGFQKRDEQRRISTISKGRDPSPTSSITTDLELDDWQHLPSSTMVENQLDEMIAGHTPVKKARLSKLSAVKESETEIATVDLTANKTKTSNRSASSKSKSSRSSRSPKNADNTKPHPSKQNEDDDPTNMGQTPTKEAELSKQSEANKSKQSNKTILSRSKSSRTTNNISVNNDNEKSVVQKSIPQARTSKLSQAIELEMAPSNIDSSINKTVISKSSRSVNNVSINKADKTRTKQSDELESETGVEQNTSVRQTRRSKLMEDSIANKTKESNRSVLSKSNTSRSTKNVDKANQSLKNKEREIIMDKNDESESLDRNSVNEGEEINEEQMDNQISELKAKDDENNMSVGNAEDSEEEIEDMDVSQEAEEDSTNDKQNKNTVKEVADQSQNEDAKVQENVNREVNGGNKSEREENISQTVGEINKIKENSISLKTAKEGSNRYANVSKQQKDEKSVSNKKQNGGQEILEQDRNENDQENVSEVEEDNKNENKSEMDDDEQDDEEEEENLVYQDSDNDEVDNADQENEEISRGQDEQRQENDESENEEEDIEQKNATKELNENEVNESDIENEDDANESQEAEHESENEDEGNESQEAENESENEDETNQSQEIEHESDNEQNEEEANESQGHENESENEDETNQSQEIEHESENEDEANESQEAENEDEPNESQEIEHESENEQDEGESQEIENESEQDEPNESEQDEPNESQEIESEQDEKMEASHDADEAIADEISEDEHEEMEVDDNNEESQELDAEAVHTEEVIEESPNVTHDTTGRNRKKIKSPEVILHDKTNQDVSFTAKGRNTSIRKTKSMYKDLNIRPSLAPQRDSLGLSGPDSSAEGSGWDSHRTTRKTLRQTFGRDFTIRKSLRALVMEKSAKQTEHMETLHSETVKFPQANSTELPEDSNREDVSMESDHEMSRRTRLTTLETYLQKIKQQNMEKNLKMEEAIRNSIKAPSARDTLNLFRVPSKPAPRKLKPASNKPKKQVKSTMLFGELPAEVIEDMKYKPPRRFQPSNASWTTKRLYKFLESKLEPKYDYKARVRAEKLVETIYNFTKELRRRDVASTDAVEVLKHEMARLDIVKTHFDFYEFFHEYMPREVRIKVVPDIVNKIPLPRHGVFTDILRGNTVRE